MNFPGGGTWEGTPLIKFCCLSCSPMETKKISHNYQLRTWNTWVILNSKIRFLRPFLGGWMPTFANWWVVSIVRGVIILMKCAMFNLILTDFRNVSTALATQRTISEPTASWRFLEYQYLEIARVSRKLAVNLVLPDDFRRIRNETDRRLVLHLVLQPLNKNI